jgi:hypothetical protein
MWRPALVPPGSRLWRRDRDRDVGNPVWCGGLARQSLSSCFRAGARDAGATWKEEEMAAVGSGGRRWQPASVAGGAGPS